MGAMGFGSHYRVVYAMEPESASIIDAEYVSAAPYAAPKAEPIFLLL